MQKAICLASGGLDSSTCLYLLKSNGIQPLPVFVDYGQLNHEREYAALERVCVDLDLINPVRFDVSGYGKVIRSGLTDSSMHINSEAFTPCRNLLLITLAASYAYSVFCNKIVLGFLTEETLLFPDQSDFFIQRAQDAVTAALGVSMHVVAPLRAMSKADVVTLIRKIGVKTYYSCHAGTEEPCGICIACKEYEGDR